MTVTLTNIEKMLQAVINGLSSFKIEVSQRFDQVDQKIEDLKKDNKKLVKRLDKIGLQLAYLEDDAPTREEFEKLEKKVDKQSLSIDRHIASHSRSAN